MATERVNNLRAFKGFVDQQFTSGEPDLTVEEVLARWEHENQTEDERAETLQAIREGLADVEAGRTRPAREAIAELRRKHNLPELS